MLDSLFLASIRLERIYLTPINHIGTVILNSLVVIFFLDILKRLKSVTLEVY